MKRWRYCAFVDGMAWKQLHRWRTEYRVAVSLEFWELCRCAQEKLCKLRPLPYVAAALEALPQWN